ncbi:hypothetical protein RFM99_02390 [Mesorhizobium sp. VK4C]|uniref:hypothetical protein n=1 Tax=Mesorhizobium captivum TaxID=3072319 RepID=UPI002A248778|nr:hypothetical protein [Mesorhizobium sp. VK4C]MDX8497258.1 hypothetical protein [Mesorhizobium sp. VK4C]
MPPNIVLALEVLVPEPFRHCLVPPKGRKRERQMAVRCRVSIDDARDVDELAFQELPRVGESVSMPVEGSNMDLRVLRVVHMPGSEQGATTKLELTSKIL